MNKNSCKQLIKNSQFQNSSKLQVEKFNRIFFPAKLYGTNIKFILQFFVSLYGHKLPVLCMDISYDSKIICTGSADRNVKIWGMDFGDCHKSIFAHDDSVKGLKFVPKTHYFFTCGKDGRVKQWDADNYERIMTLEVTPSFSNLEG